MLRNSLIASLIKSFSVIGVLAIATWVVWMIADGRVQHYNKLNGEVTKLSSDISTLQQKLAKAEKLWPNYQTLVQEQGGTQVVLDRYQAGEIIQKTQENFLFNSMRAAISTEHEIASPQYKNSFVQGMACDISLSLEALSDEDVIRFLGQLRNTLPGGALKVTGLALSRTSEITPETERAILANGRLSLIKADIKMEWMGMMTPIKPSADDKKKGAK